MDYIKQYIDERVSLKKQELENKILIINFDMMEQKIDLIKRYNSLNLFQELFYIVLEKQYSNFEELCVLFKYITNDFINSCKTHDINQKASWTIYIETYEKFIQILVDADLEFKNIDII